MESPLEIAWPTLPRAQLDQAAQALSTRRGVVLYGAPGVGKSQLAEQLRARVERDGDVEAVWYSMIGSHAESSIPLGAVDGLLAGVDVRSTHTPRHVARLAHDAITQAAGCGGVVLQVDDAHLLDEASAQLVANLCRLGGVQVLATVRSGHPPVQPLVSLWRDDLIARIDVPTFSPDEVQQVLHTALGGPVDDDLVREVFRATDGNAMYVRELVRAGVHGGSIVDRHGVWVMAGDIVPGDRLVDLIGGELDRLSHEERDAVELIALAEPVSTTLAHPLIDDTLLDRLVATGLVRTDVSLGPARLSSTVLRLAHPVHAECVRSLISPGRRRALHHALYGDTQAWRGESLSGFLRWTAWTLECGLDIDPCDLVRAARAASSLGHYDFAIAAATAAIDRTSDTSTAVEALAIRAGELRYRDRPVQAMRDVDAAISLLRETPTGIDEVTADRILAIHELRAELEQYGFDRPQGAIETIDRVYGPLLARGDRTSLSRRHRMTRAARRGWAGDLAAPLAVADEVAAGDVRSEPWDLQVVAPLMLAHTWAGRTAEASALAARFAPVAAMHDAAMPRVGTEIHLVSFFVHLVTGRLELAREKGTDPQVVSGTTRFTSALTHAGVARLLAAEGRWHEADEQFQVARHLFELRDPSGFLPWSLSSEAFCAMMTGDLDRARETCLRVDRTPWRGSRAFEADIRAQVIGTMIGLHDPDAIGRATAMALWARERSHHLMELWALDLVALADPQVARDSGADRRAAELSTHVDAAFAAPMAAHVSAIVSGDRRLEDASVAQLAALGRWMPRRRTTPDLLSQREAEVASLVAAGLSSPAIAERLHLSARTVETHVSRVFAKLGVNRRHQVAEALRRHTA